MGKKWVVRTAKGITEQDLWNAEARFWEKVDYSRGELGCWLWKGKTIGTGYGRFILGPNKQVLVHRMAWVLYNGPIEDRQCVCHKCDTPLCVNPDHCFLGSHTVNNADRHAKGRSRGPRGYSNWKSKLTYEQVAEIRRLYVPYKMSGPKLGKLFGVHSSTIYGVINGETWCHAPPSKSS